MRLVPGAVLLGAAVGILAAGPSQPGGECVSEGVTGTRCLYRSFLPSSGIVVTCRDDRDCRVGYYSGDPAAPVWLTAPPPLTALPRPAVTWVTAALAQVRFGCGPGCSVSYFFEARRRKLSEPRWSVLAVDPRRLLLAEAEDRALVVRQLFSGREVMRIERNWAPAPWLGEAISDVRFDPDGRLSLTWLRGPERAVVTERMSVPSFARP